MSIVRNSLFALCLSMLLFSCKEDAPALSEIEQKTAWLTGATWQIQELTILGVDFFSTLPDYQQSTTLKFTGTADVLSGTADGTFTMSSPDLSPSETGTWHLWMSVDVANDLDLDYHPVTWDVLDDHYEITALTENLLSFRFSDDFGFVSIATYTAL